MCTTSLRARTKSIRNSRNGPSYYLPCLKLLKSRPACNFGHQNWGGGRWGHAYLKSSFSIVKSSILLPFSRRMSLVIVAALLQSVNFYVTVTNSCFFFEDFFFTHKIRRGGRESTRERTRSLRKEEGELERRECLQEGELESTRSLVLSLPPRSRVLQRRGSCRGGGVSKRHPKVWPERARRVSPYSHHHHSQQWASRCGQTCPPARHHKHGMHASDGTGRDFRLGGLHVVVKRCICNKLVTVGPSKLCHMRE